MSKITVLLVITVDTIDILTGLFSYFIRRYLPWTSGRKMWRF